MESIIPGVEDPVLQEDTILGMEGPVLGEDAILEVACTVQEQRVQLWRWRWCHGREYQLHVMHITHRLHFSHTLRQLHTGVPVDFPETQALWSPRSHAS
jgi:hypothetical protein